MRKAGIKFLSSSKLTDWELTSEWEKKLEEIYKRNLGREGYERFIREIKDFVQEELKRLLSSWRKSANASLQVKSSQTSLKERKSLKRF